MYQIKKGYISIGKCEVLTFKKNILLEIINQDKL